MDCKCYCSNGRKQNKCAKKWGHIMHFIKILMQWLFRVGCNPISKVNESRYKQCGVTPHFSTGQSLLKKYWEKLLALSIEKIFLHFFCIEKTLHCNTSWLVNLNFQVSSNIKESKHKWRKFMQENGKGFTLH